MDNLNYSTCFIQSFSIPDFGRSEHIASRPSISEPRQSRYDEEFYKFYENRRQERLDTIRFERTISITLLIAVIIGMLIMFLLSL